MVLVFPSRTDADTKLKELVMTPIGGVILHASQTDPDFGFDGTPNLIQYIESTDGRCAVCHDFCEEDVDWLEAQGVVVLDEMPSDWQYKTEIIT